MKFTTLYMQMVALVKTKRHISFFLESRNTPKDKEHSFPHQTYIMVTDTYSDELLLSEFYDDSNPDEHKRILKDISRLERKLWSANTSTIQQMEKYLEVYQWLINRSKQYTDLVFKLVIMQRNEHATAISLESVEEKQEPFACFVDEDQPESYQDLVKLVNGIKHVEQLAEKDDQMNILPD